MSSSNYQLISEAIHMRHPLQIRFGKYIRSICPHAIGTKEGVPVVLAVQFGGGGSEGVVTPEHPQWLCMPLYGISAIEPEQGGWHDGDPSTRPDDWANVILEDLDPEN